MIKSLIHSMAVCPDMTKQYPRIQYGQGVYRDVVFMPPRQSIRRHVLAPRFELDGELIPEELAHPGMLRECR